MSVSLNKLGEVELLSGRLDAARAAYTESLALCRDLRAALGDSPQVLRDLSVSLDKLGEVELLSGRLDAARAAYTEAYELANKLNQLLYGGTKNNSIALETESLKQKLARIEVTCSTNT